MNNLPIPFGHPAWIEIDNQQFKRNIDLIKRFIGKSKLCLPIKANAYGHGLIPIAKAAEEVNVDYLAVSCLQEGGVLREAGIKLPILVFGAIHEEQIPELLEYDLEITLSSLYKAKMLAEKCEAFNRTCRVHIEVDTGMQRTGVRPDTALQLLEYIDQTKHLQLAGIYTHLATADSANDVFATKQIQTFKSFLDNQVLKNHPNILCHVANSGGVCNFPASHMDMVRPGLLSFGYFPCQHLPALAGIKPFLSIKAKVAYFKVVGEGEGISYNHTYHTRAQTRIVTVPIGYGDGFRRSLSNKGEVIIRGKRYPIVGTVCMDQCMVDIGSGEAYVGDEVTLIGKQDNAEITLNEMAKLCDTIPYEILCGFNDRLPRYYY